MLPAGMLTETPSTVSVTVSGMHDLRSRHALGQIRRDWNRSFSIHDLRDKQFRRSQRRRDTKTLVSRGEIKSLVVDVWANQQQLSGVAARNPAHARNEESLRNAGRYSIARSSMRVRIEVSTLELSMPNCRDEPINNCPVLRG